MTKKKKEIVVKAPFFIRNPKERPDVDTVVEKLRFFNVCGQIRNRLIWPIIGINFVLISLTIFGLIQPIHNVFHQSILINVTLFLGILNIFNGLLLLANE